MREIIKIFQDMMRKITEAGWKKADAENVKEEDIRYVLLKDRADLLVVKRNFFYLSCNFAAGLSCRVRRCNNLERFTVKKLILILLSGLSLT